MADRQWNVIEGGVCAAKGFMANGLNCGLNPDKNKNDLGMVVSEVICDTAAVYTTNKVKGAPIIVTKANLAKSGGKSKAIIVNSKNANTCNADGVEKAEKMCKLASAELMAQGYDVKEEEVIVASTGVIGQIIPMEPFETHMSALVAGLSTNGNLKAANAIMTTDTVKKEYAVTFEAGGVTCTMGGMAKGSGMIHPNMATTLNFVTTDVAIDADLLQKALSEIVKVTYNCLSVDGDTSTNDTVAVLASGLAENVRIEAKNDDYKNFVLALAAISERLVKLMAKDGEGATKLVECQVGGAKTKEIAKVCAKSVICSSLVKAAMFGADANWGRILCALGYSGADIDVNKVDVYFKSAGGEILVCKNGAGVEFSEEKAKEILVKDEVYIIFKLGDGEFSANAYGCDLTYDYVKINGDYRT